MLENDVFESAADIAAVNNIIGAKSVPVAATLQQSMSRAQASAHYIETRDGTHLYWREVGSGHPILFLNGWAMDTHMWDYQMADFADRGFRCIGIDRRGHGRSDQPAHGYDSDTLADDIADVIETLDVSGLTLIGHSMAGGEIVRYLSRHGEARIARVVLLAPTTPCLGLTKDNPNGLPQEAFEALRTAWKTDFPKWVADNTAAFFVPETTVAMMQWGASQVLKISLPVALACNRAMAAADFRAEMKKIGVPVLILHGDRDVSAPIALTGKPSAELIPRCRFKLYEGAPHGLLYTHMERVNADILQFIRET
jgi:non-heme chloroperoxidase